MGSSINPAPVEQPDGSVFYKMPNCSLSACYACEKEGYCDRSRQCKHLHVSVYGVFCRHAAGKDHRG